MGWVNSTYSMMKDGLTIDIRALALFRIYTRHADPIFFDDKLYPLQEFCIHIYNIYIIERKKIVCFLASWAPPLGVADGTEGIFGFYRTRVGCGPASGPTLKKRALCHTCPVVGRRIN